MRTSLLLLLAVLAGAADVELSLTNGRTVRGELVRESDAQITLRSRFPARGVPKQVESSYAKSDILKRKELPSPAQQYEERKARTPDTVPEQCTLAQWAQENCLREQAKSHALRVLELDPDNAWARRILDNCGYIEVSSQWVDEVEHFKANGLVRLDGEIVKAEVAEARRTYSRIRRDYDSAVHKLAETNETAAGRAGSATAAEGKAKEAVARAESMKKAVEEAEKALAAAKEEPVGRGDEERRTRLQAIEAANRRLNEVRNQQSEAKRAAEKARQSGISDKAAADRAKATSAELAVTIAKLDTELKAAAAKLPADDPLLATPVPVTPAVETKPAGKAQAPAADKPEQPAEPDQPKVRRLRSGGGD